MRDWTPPEFELSLETQLAIMIYSEVVRIGMNYDKASPYNHDETKHFLRQCMALNGQEFNLI